MPSKKIQCPTCGGAMAAKSQQCRKCRPPYDRTPQHRAKMTAAREGKPRPSMRGRKRPDHAATMKAWWTPERREEARQRFLARNPMARYHGLSCRGARALRESLGRCERCGHDGSESRLDVHHRNGDKRDQSLGNLTVLCHRCHMATHLPDRKPRSR